MTEASNYILNLQTVYAANGILLIVFQADTLVEHFSMIETFLHCDKILATCCEANHTV